jgi:hypothetical protein
MRQMGKHLIWPEPPGLRLERGPIHEPTERFPAIFFEAFPIGKDGSFEIGGIRAGSWRLSLHWGEWRFASTHSFPLGLVTNLRDGERRKLDFDLRDHLFAHVRGKVLLNGKAYQGKVTFTASDASQVEATSNEDGSFETYLRAGSYRVHVHEWPGGWDSRVAANSRLTVAAGQEVEHTVRVTGVRLRLRILDPRGSSCGGVDILTLMEGDTDTQFVGRSDEDGLVISRFLTPGLYQLRAWPKRLAKEDARARFRKEHSGDLGAMERVLVPLTTIVVDVGLGGLIEVRLPKAAGY